MGKCLLCRINDATKKNSHIIPSFIVSAICSYDGSGKRGKEIMFTMTSNDEKVYTGALPDFEYNRLFNTDTLTEERIEGELRSNTASEDYILCPCCEKRLSDYLETPYSPCYKGGCCVSGDISYIFWLSVVWRLFISPKQNIGIEVDDEIKESLRDTLLGYFSAIEAKTDSKVIIEHSNFRYWLVRCNSQELNLRGFMFGQYNKECDVFSYILGNSVLFVSFNGEAIPCTHKFYGFESYIDDSKINDGLKQEVICDVSFDEYSKCVKFFTKNYARKRFWSDVKRIQNMWGMTGNIGLMPIPWIMEVIQLVYSFVNKQGDKYKKEHIELVFNQVLKNHNIL